MPSLLYGRYKGRWNAAAQVLAEQGIRQFPVKVLALSRRFQIKVLENSRAGLLAYGQSAVSLCHDDQWYIIFDDNTLLHTNARLAIAHELGHILLGHAVNFAKKSKEERLLEEQQADQFAKELLAPSIVLKTMSITSETQIAATCEIPLNTAKEIAAALKTPQTMISPPEQQLLEQFRRI